MLTYPAVMGAVFLLAIQAGVSRPRGRGGLRRVACGVLAGNLEFNIEEEDEDIDEPIAIEQPATSEVHSAVSVSPTRTTAHASS